MGLIGCFRSLVALALLLIVAGIAWFQRDRVMDYWHDLRGTPGSAAVAEPTVTPEVADRAQAKLDALGEGATTRAALSEAELESLLRYRYRQLLPGFIDSAHVELDGDRLRLRMRVPAERLPRVDALREAAALLPDTTELTVTGQLLPLDESRISFAIDDVRVAHIPLPRRVVPAVLERLGRRDEPGLAPDAVPLPLLPGTASAYVRADSLVLLGRRASNTRN